MALVFYAVGLLGIWLVFAGTISPMTVGVGVLVTAVALILFRKSLAGKWMPIPYVRPAGTFAIRNFVVAVLFLPVFLYKIVASGVGIARLAVLPGVSFFPGIVRVSARAGSLGATTVFASLITLTPGTLSLDYDAAEDDLYIHWIDVAEYEADDIDQQVTGGMRWWVRSMNR